MKRFSFKGIILPLLLLIVGGSIAVGAYVTTKGGSIFELRKKAAPAAPSSTLYLKGPSQVKAGEQFTVILALGTSNDSSYTISGVDARLRIADSAVYVPENVISLRSVTPGTIFDSYPGLSDQQQQSVPDVPVTQTEGSSGQAAIGVTINPFVISTPASDVCPPFPGCDVINNPQIRMPWAQCWEESMKKCSRPTPTPTNYARPAADLMTISGVKNYAVDEKGRFKGFTGIDIVATLHFTAERPGKATISFVYSAPTATNDTNITGFLADQPASLQKPQERLLVAPAAYTVEVMSAVPPTPVPSVSHPPTPLPCQPRPTCLDTPPYCKLAEPAGGWCPGPTSTPRPTVVPPTPTPTPEPRVMINFRLQLEGRKSHATVADIYGLTTTTVQPSKEVLQLLGSGGSTVVVDDTFLPGGRVDKLGTIVTDQNGIGTLSLDKTYVGATYYVFLAQTPSHLRKASNNDQAIRLDVGQNPVCRAEICTQEVKYVDFGTLTAGDVYTDEKGNKDNLINTFDVGAVFAAWSGADVVVSPRDQTTFGGILPKEIGAAADLNGDGVVNNRDLAMLLTNFNKRGDTSIPPSDVKPPPDIRPLPVSTVAPQ